MFKSNNKTAEKDILALLMSKYELLLNYVLNLKLSDLKDVANCMAPNCDEVLTFTGSVWNSIPNSGGSTPDIDAIVEQVLSLLPISEILESIESLDNRITALELQGTTPVETTPRFMVFSNTIRTENPNPVSHLYEEVSMRVCVNNYGEVIEDGRFLVDANNTFIKEGDTFHGIINISSGTPKYQMLVYMGEGMIPLSPSLYTLEGNNLTIENVTGTIRIVFRFEYYFIEVRNCTELGEDTGWDLVGLRFDGIATDPLDPYDFFPEGYKYGDSFVAKPRYKYVPHSKYSNIISKEYLGIYYVEDRSEEIGCYNEETGTISISFMNLDLEIRIFPKYGIIRHLLNTYGEKAYNYEESGSLRLNTPININIDLPEGYTITGADVMLVTDTYNLSHPDVTGTMFNVVPTSIVDEFKLLGEFQPTISNETVNYGVMTWLYVNLRKL